MKVVGEGCLTFEFKLVKNNKEMFQRIFDRSPSPMVYYFLSLRAPHKVSNILYMTDIGL